MNPTLALALAESKMRELGTSQYTITARHFRLLASQILTLNVGNSLCILLEETPQIKITSKRGVYDLQDSKINELQYVHQGDIVLKNLDALNPISVKFLQTISIS